MKYFIFIFIFIALNAQTQSLLKKTVQGDQYVSVLTEKELQVIFEDVKKLDLPYQLIDGGCECRSYLTSWYLKTGQEYQLNDQFKDHDDPWVPLEFNKKFTTQHFARKVFVRQATFNFGFSDVLAPREKKYYPLYVHIVPIVVVMNSQGDYEEYIMDYGWTNEPMKVDDYILEIISRAKNFDKAKVQEKLKAVKKSITILRGDSTFSAEEKKNASPYELLFEDSNLDSYINICAQQLPHLHSKM